MYHVMSITDQADREYVADRIDIAMREREEKIAHHKAILKMMPSPDIRYGFPHGYRNEREQVMRHREAHRALQALAEDLGVAELIKVSVQRRESVL